MDTLVELYDREPIENVLAAAIFQPEHIVYICEKNVLNNRRKSAIYRILKRKCPDTTVTFYVVDSTNFQDIMTTMQKTADKFPRCTFEFTGGTDLILLGAGIFCKEHGIPGFYVDLKHSRFIDIFGCHALADSFRMPSFQVQDILAAAGASQAGHGHFSPNTEDRVQTDRFLAVWELIAEDQERWAATVAYLQQVTKASQSEDLLAVSAPMTVLAQEHAFLRCNRTFLERLAAIGVIDYLTFGKDEVHFCYANADLKKCLINHGIWLELYAFITAKRLDYFDDVQTSVMIDWDGETVDFSETKNEIDLILVKGVTPLFISCKTAPPSPLALSEISLICNKFGGELAKTVLISSSYIVDSNLPLYKRAKELGVCIIDMADIRSGRLGKLLTDIAADRYPWRH